MLNYAKSIPKPAATMKSLDKITCTSRPLAALLTPAAAVDPVACTLALGLGNLVVVSFELLWKGPEI